MAGETIKTRAVVLDIRPWSRTSHVVTWLTPEAGIVATPVKGAVRPKSAFLGQYDLNYTCEIIYYARGRGDVHALRECVALKTREALRDDYRSLALAGYFRSLAASLAPFGAECEAWSELLENSLDGLAEGASGAAENSAAGALVERMVAFEKRVLELCGLEPDFSGYDKNADWSPFSVETGRFCDNGGRLMRISLETAQYLDGSRKFTENTSTPLDAARVIGVFYQFHLDCASDIRRTVLKMIS
jgi:DNA repair protein RecO